MTTETKPKKPPAVCETRYDSSGLTVTLPKASSVALTRARDVCAGLAVAAPVLSAKANGIRKALDGLIADLSNGPIQVPMPDELDEALGGSNEP